MRALITGITGQDGAWLARLLVDRGHQVVGTSRHPGATSPNLDRLGVAHRVALVADPLMEAGGTATLVEQHDPDVIFHLAGQSSVGASFQQPLETLGSLVTSTAHLLEALRRGSRPRRMLVAGSGEMYGDTGTTPAREDSPIRPQSPYAVAKSAAHLLVGTYRASYGLPVATAILFNHESPLRSTRFVTAKVALGALRIAEDLRHGRTPEPLVLGDMTIARDWGWAPDYVTAMAAMADLPTPTDLILATGRSVTLSDFVAAAFAEVGLDWTQHVRSDPSLLRPTDARWAGADPAKARAAIGWDPQIAGAEVARHLVRAFQAGTSAA